MLSCGFFFFQAEDGIRDLVRSRGLGDVYKRQRLHLVELHLADLAPHDAGDRRGDGRVHVADAIDGLLPVSYTHLTLPTSDLV